MQTRSFGASRLITLLLTLIVLTAAMPVVAQTVADALLDSGPAPDLIMFYTGDVIGYLGPCG